MYLRENYDLTAEPGRRVYVVMRCATIDNGFDGHIYNSWNGEVIGVYMDETRAKIVASESELGDPRSAEVIEAELHA